MRPVLRILLGVFLMVAGTGHFVAAEEFLAQVPPFFPARELIVAVSGVIEICLGLALILAPERHRATVGWIAAGLFVAVFPGNLSQFFTHTDAFGLDSDLSRFVRLLFQPVLVVWALWSTGAWPRRRATN